MSNTLLKSFSKRNGYASEEVKIIIREDAPEYLRYFIIIEALQCGISIQDLLVIVCRILYEAPQGNWSHQYIQDEINNHIMKCEWNKAYDIAEAVYFQLKKDSFEKRHIQYAEKFNELCIEKGIGWQFQNDHITARTGIDNVIFNLSLKKLDTEKHATAKNEIEEAMHDISKRPADLTGSIQHALAALECVARTISGKNETLGKLIADNPKLIPKPLDEAVKKIWGYASEKGRHLREGHLPSFHEALFIVGLSTSLVTFLDELSSQENATTDDFPF